MAGFNTQYQMANDATFRQSLEICIVKVAKQVGGERLRDVQRVNMSSISRGYPTSVNSPGHGLTNTGRAYVDEVRGMVELNGKVYSYTVVDPNTIHLDIDSSNFTAHAGGGVMYDNALTVRQATKRSQLSAQILTTHDTQSGDTAGSKRWLDTFAYTVAANPAIGDIVLPTQPSDNDVEFEVNASWDDVAGVSGQDLSQ